MNDQVKEYVGQSTWVYREVAAFLWRWFDIFNEKFSLILGGPLPRPHLRFRSLPRAYGTYINNHGEAGFRFEITLDLDDCLEEGGPGFLLKVWFHELLHLWQELRGKPGKHNYHNREYRLMSHHFGIEVDNRGHTLSIAADGLFNKLIVSHGLPELKYLLPEAEPVRTSCKMLKWVCSKGCTTIRAAVEVRARCLRCGNEFHREL